MFTLRDAPYGLRGNYILSLPRSKTMTDGLHKYLAAKLWNSLPDIYIYIYIYIGCVKKSLQLEKVC